MNLSAEIREYISKNNGFCKVYPAPFAVFLNKDDKTYVEPDISIICDKLCVEFNLIIHIATIPLLGLFHVSKLNVIAELFHHLDKCLIHNLFWTLDKTVHI